MAHSAHKLPPLIVRIPSPLCLKGHLHILERLRTNFRVCLQHVHSPLQGFLGPVLKTPSLKILIQAERTFRSHRDWLSSIETPSESGIHCDELEDSEEAPVVDLTANPQAHTSKATTCFARFNGFWNCFDHVDPRPLFALELHCLSAARQSEPAHFFEVRADRTSPLRSLERSIEVLPFLFSTALQKVQLHSPLSSKAQPDQTRRRLPGTLRMIARLIASWIRERRERDQATWQLIATDGSLLDAIAERRTSSFIARPIANPPNTALADPFFTLYQGAPLLLVESIPNGSHGQISSVVLQKHGEAPRITQELRQSHHASFPFAFVHNQELYLLPEESASKRAALYTFAKDGDRWIHLRDLLSDFPAVDSVLLQHQGRWWLFSTYGGDGMQEANLCLFSSADLLGPYEKCACSPVRIGLGGARNGGAPFTIKDATFRPSQDCRPRYGDRLIIHRIAVLEQSHYDEEPWCELVLKDAGNPDINYPCHTICAYEDQVLLDAKLPSSIGDLRLELSPIETHGPIGNRARI